MQGIRNPRDPLSPLLSWFHSAKEQWHHIASENSPWWGRFIFPLLRNLLSWAEPSCSSLSTTVNESGPSRGGDTLTEKRNLWPLKEAVWAFVALSNRHAGKGPEMHKKQGCSVLHCTFKPLCSPSGARVRHAHCTHTHTQANNWH